MSAAADPLIVFVVLVFLLAGLVKGVIGMGLPTVAMGLLALAMPPVQAAALLVVPSLATNLWQLLAGPRFLALSRRLAGMMAGIVGGTLGSAVILTGDTAGSATAGLGIALVAYATVGLAGVKFAVSARREAWLSPLVGVATGLITGATGVFVIPAVPYLQALKLEKEELIQALGLSFTVSTVALAAGLLLDGALQTVQASASLLALAPALVGMLAGQWVRRRISAEAFRIGFFVGLLGLGGSLAVQAIL